MHPLQPLLKDLYQVFGINISMFDDEGNHITSSPEIDSPFCHLIKENPEGKKRCQNCDKKAFKRVQESGKLDLYQCDFLLYEACVPLYSYGLLTGFLMMGQTTLDFQVDKEAIYQKALPYIFDKKKLKEAINAIPQHPLEDIESFSHIIDYCGKVLSLENCLEHKKRPISSQIKKIIDQQFNKPLTLEMLATHFQLSKTTIENAFKERYKITIHNYITQVRIQHACLYLKQPQYSIQEISLLCGFEDPSYFTKVFKKNMGISPKAYRNQ